MEFFDQKQEVLDIQLTPYGRHLLSLGRLKPVYYAFFDDDIIYDASYGGLTETQNDIEDRILRQTPRSKQQVTFSGIETNYKRQNQMTKHAESVASPGHELVYGSMVSTEYTNLQHPLQRDYAMGMPLGKTDLDNDDPPRFQLLMLSGEIESATETLEDQTIGSRLRIPQINIDLEYELTAHDMNHVGQRELEEKAARRGNHAMFSPVFDDGTYLKIEGQHIMLMLEEFNVPFEEENFEIEVFEEVRAVKRILRNENGQTVLVREENPDYLPLFFDVESNETFLASDEEGLYLTEEDITNFQQGTVNSIFELNREDEMSVPVSYLASIVATPQQISEAMQARSSFFVSKPTLRAQGVSNPIYGFGEEFPDNDIYYTGDLSDPEDCE